MKNVISKKKRRFSGLQVFVIVCIAMAVTLVTTLILVKYYFFPSTFKPVVLNAQEQQRLEEKLDRFEGITNKKIGDNTKQQSFDKGKPPEKDEYTADGKLKPQAYREQGGQRNIQFTEREVNALLAKNTDLAEKLAIDLAKDLVSFKLLVPIDSDFPIMGGKTLRVRGGAELAYRESMPVVKLIGISVMGVPVPNSWLGGIKNIDLVKEFGGDPGAWKAFSDGVELISVDDGTLNIILKE